MLGISAEKVCYIIVKAREFDAKEGVVEPDPASHPSDDDARKILEDYPDDPTLEELKGAIDSLNTEEQSNLVALAWLGRGTYEPDGWDEALAEARRDHNDYTADYLVGMPLLADFLEEGLSALGYSCSEYEINRL